MYVAEMAFMTSIICVPVTISVPYVANTSSCVLLIVPSSSRWMASSAKPTRPLPLGPRFLGDGLPRAMNMYTPSVTSSTTTYLYAANLRRYRSTFISSTGTSLLDFASVMAGKERKRSDTMLSHEPVDCIAEIST